jgi:hypothetical protein
MTLRCVRTNEIATSRPRRRHLRCLTYFMMNREKVLPRVDEKRNEFTFSKCFMTSFDDVVRVKSSRRRDNPKQIDSVYVRFLAWFSENV